MLNFTQNSWKWGFSDDKFTWIKDSFYYWQGLEIRDNPTNLTVAKSAIKDSWVVVEELVEELLYVSTATTLIAFWATKIYKKKSNVWSECYDWFWGQHAVVFWDYVYWINTNRLHRILVSDIDEADWTAFIDVGATYPISLTYTSSFTKMFVWGTKMYFWNGKNLCMLEGSIFTQDKLEFTDEIIQEISYSGSAIKIYTNFNWVASAYLWDWDSEDTNSRVTWEWETINWVTNKEWRDYVMVSGWKLYITDWYNRQLQKDVNWNWWPLVAIDNLIYFWWDGGVWTWWALNKNYSEVLNFDFPYSQFTTDAFPTIWAITEWRGDTYISRSNWTDYWIDTLENATGTGYVEWLIYTGGVDITEKEINRLYFTYLAIPSWAVYVDESADAYEDEELAIYWLDIAEDDYIKLELDINNSWTFEEELVMDWTEDELYKSTHWPFTDFNYVQYRLTLKKRAEYTPTVTSIWFDFDYVENNYGS